MASPKSSKISGGMGLPPTVKERCTSASGSAIAAAAESIIKMESANRSSIFRPQCVGISGRDHGLGRRNK